MQVIRYCVPFDDHELKKLVCASRHPSPSPSLTRPPRTRSYVYFETVDKTDAATGKLREEMILVCNFLRKDLMHANEFVRGCALRFVAKLKEFELLEPLVKPIKENLDHRHSYVRRNAVLALHNAYRVSETLCVDAPEIMERQLKVHLLRWMRHV
jgi:coatomer subunit beta